MPSSSSKKVRFELALPILPRVIDRAKTPYHRPISEKCKKYNRSVKSNNNRRATTCRNRKN